MYLIHKLFFIHAILMLSNSVKIKIVRKVSAVLKDGVLCNISAFVGFIM